MTYYSQSTRSFIRTLRKLLAVGSLTVAIGGTMLPAYSGALPAPVVNLAQIGLFEGLATPTRIFDSRTGANPARLAAGETEITLVGAAATAPAIWVTVTAIAPTVNTYLTVFGGAQMPPSSNVNVAAGQTRANLVVVRPVGGKIKIYNQAGTVDVAIDLAGLSGTGGAALAYTSTAPNGSCRVVDTRPGLVGDQEGGTACMAAPGIDSLVPLMNRDGSPTDPETLELGPDIATPVVAGTPLSAFLAMSGYAVITITALNATAPTYLTVYSGGLPTTSNLNLKPGEIVSNQVVVPVDNTGQILIANNSGSVDVIIDSVGSFSGGAKQLYSDTNANRLVDTRTNEVPTKVSTLDVVIPGAIPGSSAVISLTVTDPVGAGHMLAHATGASPVPGTSNLNFAAGETRAVQVIVPVSPSGSITISTSGTTTHVVVDLIATLDNIVT